MQNAKCKRGCHLAAPFTYAFHDLVRKVHYLVILSDKPNQSQLNAPPV
jgi:hypothetical protein